MKKECIDLIDEELEWLRIKNVAYSSEDSIELAFILTKYKYRLKLLREIRSSIVV
jgi:hypothetical protein